MPIHPLKQKIINGIIEVEGSYVNDPHDSGGETNFGITKKVARNHGYQGAMIDLPREIAFDIYSAKYWDAVKGDQLIELSEMVTEEVVDTSVNMGPSRAVQFLQRSLNVLNSSQGLYADLKVDGHIGLATMSALATYVEVRDAKVLTNALNCLQGNFYIELAEKREKDERFVYGWLKHRVKI